MESTLVVLSPELGVAPPEIVSGTLPFTFSTPPISVVDESVVLVVSLLLLLQLIKLMNNTAEKNFFMIKVLGMGFNYVATFNRVPIDTVK